MDTQTTSVFERIVEFVNDLNTVFGKTHKNIGLYNRLLEKTTVSNEKPVLKHVSIFKDFLSENIEALKARSSDKLNGKIVYSERVNLDISVLLSEGDSNTCSAIWQHLLTINAILFPTSEALTLLQSEPEDTDFIKEIIDTVSNSIDPSSSSDPMTLAMELMSSGKLTGIVSSMTSKFTSGEIDPDKMLEKVNKMYSTITAGNENAPDLSSIISSLTNSQK